MRALAWVLGVTSDGLKVEKREEQGRERELESPPDATLESEPSVKFSDRGALPPVDSDWATVGPTASDLAFGASTNVDPKASVKRPAQHPSKAPPADVAERDQKFQPKKGLEYDPRFTSMALGKMNEANAPSAVDLPPDVQRGLDVAWQRSQKDKKEHGGNLVRTYGGKFEVRHGGADADEGQWMPDENDRGFHGDLLGFVHTHPYDGYEHGTFSGDDLANLCDYDTRMSIVRSGSMSFMVVKTKEFDEKLQREVESERDHRKLVEKREAFKAKIKQCFEMAFGAQEGDFPTKLEAGVIAVCSDFHLSYYAGEGGHLTRQSSRGR
jgi:hypothetical protein